MFFSSQSNDVIGHAFLAVLLINTVLYTVSFLATRILSFCSLRKTRPIPMDEKNKFIATGITKSSAWIGGLFYLAGSNIQHIITLNPNDFNCDLTCLHEVGDTSTVLLVIASLLFTINEIHSGKMLILIRDVTCSLVNGDDDDDDDQEDWLTWARTAECLSFIRVFDSSFTTVASLPNHQVNANQCSRFEVGIIWSMYGVLMVVWGLLLIVIMGPGVHMSWKKRQITKIILKYSIAFVIFFATGSLLIGSNLEPLGCNFNCNIYSANFTEECDLNYYHGTRMSLLLLSLVLFSPLCVCLTLRWVQLTRELQLGSLSFGNVPLETNIVTELQVHTEITLLEYRDIPL